MTYAFDLASTLTTLLVVALPVTAFAALAFPLATLADSFRIVLTGHSRCADAAEMAVGVFAALGQAALLAGINGALVALAWSFFGPGHLRAEFAAAALVLGLALRLVIAWPLERAAFHRLVA